jgi:hypothetical protein
MRANLTFYVSPVIAQLVERETVVLKVIQSYL